MTITMPATTWLYVGVIVYTVLWLIVWVRIILHRNKEIKQLEDDCEKIIKDYDKLNTEYHTLKEEYNRLEGKHEALISVMEWLVPNSENPPIL